MKRIKRGLCRRSRQGICQRSGWGRCVLLTVLLAVLLLWLNPAGISFAGDAGIATATATDDANATTTDAATDDANATATAAADTVRNIYIGDIVTLEVSAQGFSEEVLRQAFSDFEVIAIERGAERGRNNSYRISVRSFDVGEKTVNLGDKDLVIRVTSTLEDIQRDGIFEGGTDIIKPGFPLQRRVVFFVVAGIFVLSCGVVIVKSLKKQKSKQENPYQLFLRRIAELSVEDENYFVALTFYFKRYIEGLYRCRIIGKTSKEIIAGLQTMRFPDDELTDIRQWLMECDRLKFTGVGSSPDEKTQLGDWLMKLVQEIEAARQETETKTMNRVTQESGF